MLKLYILTPLARLYSDHLSIRYFPEGGYYVSAPFYFAAHAHFGDGCERVRRCCAQVYNGDHGREQLPGTFMGNNLK